MPTNFARIAGVALLTLLLAACGKDNSTPVGKISVDWTGNDIAIEAVPEGQVEAARALGLSRGQIFRKIVAPQAFRIILPPLGNDFVSMIKDSALVSSLGVQDITQLGKVYSAATFKFFDTYNVVAFLYLTMTISLSLVVRYIEHRLKRTR